MHQIGAEARCSRDLECCSRFLDWHCVIGCEVPDLLQDLFSSQGIVQEE